jgi:hypothetical protein
MIDIELVPHIGKQSTPLGEFDVDLGQYYVMARTEFTGERGVHVGFICRPCADNPRPPFNGLDNFRRMPESVKDEIVKLVQHKLGLAQMRVTEVPEPIEISEEDDIDDVDEG